MPYRVVYYPDNNYVIEDPEYGEKLCRVAVLTNHLDDGDWEEILAQFAEQLTVRLHIRQVVRNLLLVNK